MKPITIPNLRDTGITHSSLRLIGTEWLRKREMTCSVIISDLFSLSGADTTRGEQADVIGWFGRWSTVIECKVSRKDFFDNQHKPWIGMGQWRYFLIPQALVSASEVPSDYGLLEWDGAKVHTTLEAPLRQDYDVHHEIELLITAIRCMQPHGIRVNYYTSPVNKASMSVESLTNHLTN